MLQPYINSDARWAQTWQELGDGVPTLAGFARLCSLALADAPRADVTLSPEAKAILFAARELGIVEIKGAHRAFDAPARLLAVHVELPGMKSVALRNRSRPEITIRMLSGFRELCAAGLVMHHIYADFSLTREGFERARQVQEDEVASTLHEATELFGVE
jgi:hypothetical protein